MKNFIILFMFVSAITNIYALPTSQGLGSGGATVQNAVIDNTVSGNFTATNNSTINTGINLPSANIKNSVISNNTSGNINASNRSKVNTGLDAANAEIENSSVATSSNVNINSSSSSVTTGVSASKIRNSEVSTNVNANINAVNSNVDVGAVKGDIQNKRINTNVSTSVNARNEAKSVGSVYVSGNKVTKTSGGSTSVGESGGIGNVVVQSNNVKEVNTAVGRNAGKIGQNTKTKHMAKYYNENDGVAPDGTKYTYVSAKDRSSAEKTGGSTGNTVIQSGSKVKKVSTYVE